MGLKNYNSQLSNLKSCEKQIAELRSYGNSMSALVISLQSVWSLNADYNVVCQGINKCIGYANAIIDDYSAYENEAMHYLNKLNLLEEIKHKFPRASKADKAYQVGTPSAGNAKRDIIEINTIGFFDSFRGQLRSYSSNLEKVKNSTTKINNKIDQEIKKQFKSNGNLLVKIAKHIEQLITYNNGIIEALNLVEAAYTGNESNLENLALNLSLNGNASGTSDGTVNKSYVNYRSKVKYGNWPVAQYFGIELGEVASKRDGNEILNYIEARNSTLATQGANLQHHCTRHTAEKLATLGIHVTHYGNGNTWYDNLKNHYGWSSDKPVNIDCFDGDSFWSELGNSVQEPIYNLVISYSKAGDPWGHVLMIDAIVDGVVYYSDNYDSTGKHGGRRGAAQAVSIDEFRRLYSVQGYKQQGVVHFMGE